MNTFDVGLCSTDLSLDPLKALLSAANPKSCILLFSNGKRAGKAFLRLNRRKYRLFSYASEYDLRTLQFTGRFVALWVAKHASDPEPLCPLFCRSKDETHIRTVCRDKKILNLLEN